MSGEDFMEINKAGITSVPAAPIGAGLYASCSFSDTASYTAIHTRTVKVPGKLYILGEYAVVDGYPAIIAPVDRYLTVTVSSYGGEGSPNGTVADTSVREDSETFARGKDALPAAADASAEAVISSSLFPDEECRIPLNRFIQEASFYGKVPGRIRTHTDWGRMAKVGTAACVALEYLSEKSIPLQPCTIAIDSQLDDKNSGRKYGLGSSGAAVVGVIKGILEFYADLYPAVSRETFVNELVVYKLSALALLALGDNGSYGDVACCSYCRPVYYVRPDMQWLKDHANLPVAAVLNSEWPKLQIRPLAISQNITFITGWTGNPASSAKLVEAVGSYKQVCSDDFEEYCRGVARCADIFARCCAGLRTADIQHALAAISDASQLMHGLSDAVEKYYYNGDDSAGLSGAQETSMKIETDTLKELIDIAERYGLAGKVSGAGGGDCGIAAGADLTRDIIEDVQESWEAAGIISADFTVMRC